MSSSFENLVKPDRYQVFVFSCHSAFPVSFVRHHWFVTNRKGEIGRWEVLFKKKREDHLSSHLFKNDLPPFSGVGVLYFQKKFLWKPRLLAVFEGDEHSRVKEMIDVIESAPHAYPRAGEYSLIGFNCNTFIKWVLNQFPEYSVKLEWNSWGKSYDLFK